MPHQTGRGGSRRGSCLLVEVISAGEMKNCAGPEKEIRFMRVRERGGGSSLRRESVGVRERLHSSFLSTLPMRSMVDQIGLTGLEWRSKRSQAQSGPDEAPQGCPERTHRTMGGSIPPKKGKGVQYVIEQRRGESTAGFPAN